MACQKDCGFGGRCALVADNATDPVSGAFCECHNGFSQTLELNYFIEDESQLNSSPCNYHVELLTAFYSLALCLLILGGALELSTVKSGIAGVKKRLPYLTFCTFSIIACTYKLVTPADAALLGVDFGFSFIFSQIYASIEFQVGIFLTKYFRYINKKVLMGPIAIDNEHSALSFRLGNLLIRFQRSRDYFYVIVIQLYWVSALVFQSDVNTAFIIMRTALAYVVFESCLRILSYQFFLGEICKDMEKVLLHNAAGMREANTSEYASKNEENIGKSQANIAFLEGNIRAVRKNKNRLITVDVTIALLHLLPVVSDFWIGAIYPYIIPFLFISCVLQNFVTILGRAKMYGWASLCCFDMIQSISTSSKGGTDSTNQELSKQDGPTLLQTTSFKTTQDSKTEFKVNKSDI